MAATAVRLLRKERPSISFAPCTTASVPVTSSFGAKAPRRLDRGVRQQELTDLCRAGPLACGG